MEENRSLGLACAMAVICVWSSFFVFSRMGAQSSLTAYDITALRLIVAAAFTLPFLYRWWPRHISFGPAALLALSGPGTLYAMLSYTGLQEASAALGGVFSNGSMPIFTMLLVAIIAGQLPSRGQVIGVTIIVLGAILLAVSDTHVTGGNTFIGIAYFLAASALLSVYIFALRYWNITPWQALALINIPNAVVFLPIWYFALPTGLAQTDTPTIVFQALFQGLGPGYLAVILFALSTRHLGPTLTAGFAAVVPTTAAILAVPLLGEIPTAIGWGGIILASFGLILLVRAKGN